MPETYKSLELGSYIAIKAVGEWEIDILAVPFMGKDSENQYFDQDTDTMQESFPLPALFYHHGVKPGAKELQENPIVIGKSLSVKKTIKGWVIRGLLDKTSEYAKLVWEAVKKGAVAVSSDSIAHLARLDIGGKIIQYEKNRAGRISVWPLAGVSLWDLTAGNFKPASHQAIALPAMKAIYRDAGILFPDLDTTGVLEADETAKRRAEIIKNSERILLNSRKRRKI